MPYTDPTNTKLLCHFNGTTGDKPTPATTGQTITYVSGAAVSTAQEKWSGSLLLNGSSDYVTVPDSADWNFGTGDFTIDFWIRFVDNTLTSPLFDHYTGPKAHTTIRFDNGSIFIGRLNASEDWEFMVRGNCSLPNNEWHHIAVVRSGTGTDEMKIYRDGVDISAILQVGAWDYSFPDETGTVRIGYDEKAGVYTSAYIDEYRILKGEAAWTSGFTPPTAEWQVGTADSKNLVCQIDVEPAIAYGSKNLINSITSLLSSSKNLVNRISATVYGSSNLVNSITSQVTGSKDLVNSITAEVVGSANLTCSIDTIVYGSTNLVDSITSLVVTGRNLVCRMKCQQLDNIHLDGSITVEVQSSVSLTNRLMVLLKDLESLVNQIEVRCVSSVSLTNRIEVRVLDTEPLVNRLEVRVLSAKPLGDSIEVRCQKTAQLVNRIEVRVKSVVPLTDSITVLLLDSADLVNTIEVRIVSVVGGSVICRMIVRDLAVNNINNRLSVHKAGAIKSLTCSITVWEWIYVVPDSTMWTEILVPSYITPV